MRRAAVLVAVVVCACGAKNEAIVCDSKTENVLAGCKATYDLCKGGQDVLDCSDGARCSCIENGAKVKDFPIGDACNVSPDTLVSRAANGCGWTLD